MLTTCIPLLLSDVGTMMKRMTSTNTAEAFESGTMLNDFANTVVLATYTELDSKAGELLAAVKALAADTSQANLEKAQQAWKATRKPWEQSEAFLFGPR